jgi:protein with PEP-CTERM/exosortase system signal
MTTQTRLFLALVCASLLVASSPAEAGFVVTVQQVGPNVVATGSGAIDLAGLSPMGSNNTKSLMAPGAGVIITGPAAPAFTDDYTGFTGPYNFGSSGLAFASSGSGDMVGIDVSFGGGILVPHGYMSNIPLSDSAIYDNATFSSLSVTPGTYEWIWGTGANQNFTLQIGAAKVPDTGSTLAFLALGLAALLGASRVRSSRLA